MKRFLTVIMSVMLLFSILVMPNYAEGNNEQNKISEELQMHIDQDEEEIPVYIWFEEIDLETINAEAEKAVGYTQEDIQAAEDNIPLFNSDLNESDPDFDEAFLEYAEQTRTQRAAVLEMQNKLIEAQRRMAREAYVKHNTDKIAKVDINERSIVYISKYSPVLIASLSKTEIRQLDKNPSVYYLDYHETKPFEEEMAVAMPTVGAYYVKNTLGFDGNNVNIGIVDGGRIDAHTELNNTNITRLNPSASVSSHSTNVARIISGSNGAAPNAHLYGTSNLNGGITGLEEAIETLLSNNVSVINMSLGQTRSNNNYYTAYEQWIDHIANQHGVTLVKSAGNIGVYSDVTVPGLAHNIITVGGTNTKQTINTSDDTLYSIDSNKGSCSANGGTSGCAKPDFLAPAYYSNMEDDNGNFGLSWGTSYAAPMVTGIIAQMIECKPTIANKPALIKAVLTSSTTRKVSPGSGPGSVEAFESNITAQQGAGEVNAKKAIMILNNGTYATGTISSSTITKTFPVTSSDLYIRYSVAWLRKNTVSGSNHGGTVAHVGPAANLKLRIYNSNNTSVFTSDVETSSVELAHALVNGVYGTYKAKIYRMDSGTFSCTYAVAWR